MSNVQERRGATVKDGVKMGCGALIVLPIIVIAILLLFGMFLDASKGTKSTSSKPTTELAR